MFNSLNKGYYNHKGFVIYRYRLNKIPGHYYVDLLGAKFSIIPM